MNFLLLAKSWWWHDEWIKKRLVLILRRTRLTHCGSQAIGKVGGDSWQTTKRAPPRPAWLVCYWCELDGDNEKGLTVNTLSDICIDSRRNDVAAKGRCRPGTSRGGRRDRCNWCNKGQAHSRKLQLLSLSFLLSWKQLLCGVSDFWILYLICKLVYSVYIFLKKSSSERL